MSQRKLWESSSFSSTSDLGHHSGQPVNLKWRAGVIERLLSKVQSR